MRDNSSSPLRILIASLAVLVFTLSFLVDAIDAKTSWEMEWKKTLSAAKKEGRLVIYGPGGREKVYVHAFRQAYPDIRVSYASGRLSSLVSRIMAEWRAGKPLVDLLIGGTTIPLSTLKKAKMLRPIRPLLLLPDVINTSGWFKNQLWFADVERKYIPVWRGEVSTLFAINTNQAKAKEFKSYQDLLNPKWRGKIVAQDPRRPGSAANLAVFLYYTPELGPKYLKRLFGEMDITYSRNRYQIVEWVAAGKYAINLFAPVDKDDIKAGLPLAKIWVQPAPLGAGAASASLLNRAPHPNAARVFLNWLLSREGQNAYQKILERNSLRTDIPKPKELLDHAIIPQEDREYFFYSLEEHDSKQRNKEYRKFLSQVIGRR